ncbi:MAG: hypothetical protein EKK56_02315 [Flavobacteriaceae bacterium]|nr:MAG: hypothetical protein EKK56_02310 [Flavobacteriaceae bacterium]RTL14080.1 MAG: hypothetical protein EKK56_02315 [Flavobacteriaceae bacterium]
MKVQGQEQEQEQEQVQGQVQGQVQEQSQVQVQKSNLKEMLNSMKLCVYSIVCYAKCNALNQHKQNLLCLCGEKKSATTSALRSKPVLSAC